MPELPEVEHLRRKLIPALVGSRVARVRLARQDIVQRDSTTKQRRVSSRELLGGDVIRHLRRHGKNLAIIGRSGRVLCVHLGMSGQLRYVRSSLPLAPTSHVHCTWWLESAKGSGRLIFRDPRRFGGLRPFQSLEGLRRCWSELGPDALTIEPAELRDRLQDRARPIKAALLDQSLIAGVGNIYADEALFQARIHPLQGCAAISPRKYVDLAREIQLIMRSAINSGGSTIRSYVDSDGANGQFALKHRVYGRAGQPCLRCGAPLNRVVVAQRTTVYCGKCQPICR